MTGDPILPLYEMDYEDDCEESISTPSCILASLLIIAGLALTVTVLCTIIDPPNWFSLDEHEYIVASLEVCGLLATIVLAILVSAWDQRRTVSSDHHSDSDDRETETETQNQDQNQYQTSEWKGCLAEVAKDIVEALCNAAIDSLTD